MNDTAHRRGRLAARVRAPRDQQQDKSQESAERSLGACCARAVIAPSPSVWYPKAISFRSHVVLASFITCIILHVHAHRGVACVRTCVHLVHVQTRVCHAVADVYRETRQRVYVSTSSHQTHNSETDDRHTRPQCIALNCNTIRKSVTISVCASASPATSRARPSECAPIITRRRGCQCAFRPATHSRLRPLAPIWPPARAGTASTAGSTRTCASPLAARPTRRPPRRARPATPRTRLLSVPSRVCHLGSSREVEGAGVGRAEERRPRRLRLCPRRLALEHLLAAQVVRDDEASRVHRPVRGVSHRIGDLLLLRSRNQRLSAIHSSRLAPRKRPTLRHAHAALAHSEARPRAAPRERAGRREEGKGQVGRAECVAQRHVRVAAVLPPVHPTPSGCREALWQSGAFPAPAAAPSAAASLASPAPSRRAPPVNSVSSHLLL